MEQEQVRPRPARPTPPGHLTVSEDVTGGRQLQRIRQLHEEAYLYIEQGLSCDEKGQTAQAVTLYTKGLRDIDTALNIETQLNPEHRQGDKWSRTVKIIEKMKTTKRQIQDRVEKLIQTDSDVARSLDDPPPAYEVATTPTPVTDLDLALQESMLTDIHEQGASRNMSQMANAKEIFKIQDGVQIFYITPEGYVSAPSYPSQLGIYKFTNQTPSPQGASNLTERPPAFLKVGDWTYPLVPGCSPALHASWGAYVFPDVSASDIPGQSVGVLIPDSISDAEKQRFEKFLNELTAMRLQEDTVVDDFVLPHVPETEPEREAPIHVEEEAAEEERASVKVAKGIVTAGEWISWGLGKGAEKAGVLMKKGSDLLQEKLKPEDKPSEIDPRAQQGVYYARQATGAAVKVSGFVVKKLGEGTVALARMAAPHVRAQGEKLLPKSVTSKSGDGHSKIDDVTEVAMGGLKGWATVYTGLEKAAKALATSLTKETVTVVSHKYGSQAGQLTENTLFTAGNLGVAAHNFNNLGVKAIAKRAAKDTGKAVMEDYKNAKQMKGAQEEKPGNQATGTGQGVGMIGNQPSGSGVNAQSGATSRDPQRQPPPRPKDKPLYS